MNRFLHIRLLFTHWCSKQWSLLFSPLFYSMIAGCEFFISRIIIIRTDMELHLMPVSASLFSLLLNRCFTYRRKSVFSLSSLARFALLSLFSLNIVMEGSVKIAGREQTVRGARHEWVQMPIKFAVKGSRLPAKNALTFSLFYSIPSQLVYNNRRWWSSVTYAQQAGISLLWYRAVLLLSHRITASLPGVFIFQPSDQAVPVTKVKIISERVLSREAFVAVPH